MTTTTANEQTALANATEGAAVQGTAIAALPKIIEAEPMKNVHASKDVLPFSHRELRTAGELLALKVEQLVRDFEKKTGARVTHLSTDYSSKVSVSLYDADNNYIL